jgi:hypothetical protein
MPGGYGLYSGTDRAGALVTAATLNEWPDIHNAHAQTAATANAINIRRFMVENFGNACQSDEAPQRETHFPQEPEAGVSVTPATAGDKHLWSGHCRPPHKRQSELSERSSQNSLRRPGKHLLKTHRR